jgi:hypothetical protein
LSGRVSGHIWGVDPPDAHRTKEAHMYIGIGTLILIILLILLLT